MWAGGDCGSAVKCSGAGLLPPSISVRHNDNLLSFLCDSDLHVPTSLEGDGSDEVMWSQGMHQKFK